MIRQKYGQILRKGEEGENLPEGDTLLLLSTPEEEEKRLLFEVAERVRKRFLGDEVHLRGIIEFSNICTQNCFYCGLRRENAQPLAIG